MRASFIIWFAVAALVAAIGVSIAGWLDSQTMLGVVGAISAAVFFLLQNALETARFQRDLFIQFNARYDALNDRLSDALKQLQSNTNDPLTPEQKNLFEDYFNLCSEEYFYRRENYIHERVWQAWLLGMRWWYRQDPRIAKFWETELAQGTYYGMKISDLTGR